MTNYAELTKDSRVASVDYPGAGIGVVKLKAGLTSNGQTSCTAWCFRVAKEFVEAAA